MIKVPEPKVVKIDKLKADQNNPNRMTPQQLARLKTSIQKYGFIVPIITNRDFLIADGEQRLTVAKQLGLKKVSVIQLDVKDVDRRLLRQVLNKLRGEHELVADALEFERIINVGRKDDLKHLLDLSEAELKRYSQLIKGPTEIPPPKPIEAIETDIQLGERFQLGNSKLICGNCIDTLETMKAESVDFVMFSPPYWSLRDYQVEGQIGNETHPSQYIINIQNVCQKVKAVLKETGAMYLVLGDSYAGSGLTLGRHKRTVKSLAAQKAVSGFLPKEKPKWSKIKSNWIQRKQKLMIPSRVAIALQDDGWILRNEIVWAKPDPCPESVKDRYSQKWESIFFFVKSRKYWFDLDAIKTPIADATRLRQKRVFYTQKKPQDKLKAHRQDAWSLKVTHGKVLGKNPGDVWRITTATAQLRHPAIYPEQLCMFPIESSCPPNGIVLDPMAGSGTTLLVAEKLGRKFVGVELNPKYCQIILDRWEKYTGEKAEKID